VTNIKLYLYSVTFALVIGSAVIAVADANCFVDIIKTSCGSNIFQIAYSCPGAEAVRISERPNIIRHNWLSYSGPATQEWAWMGSTGTGSLYIFFKLTNAEILRTSIVIDAPSSMIDTIFKGSFGYSLTYTSNYFPNSYSGNNTFCSITEIGLRALGFILAYEEKREWSPSWETTQENLLGILNRLLALEKYDGHAFYWGYSFNSTNSIDTDHIPSVDNALLAACLYCIKGYCAQRPFLEGASDISNKCAQILSPMDFSIWYKNSNHRFGWTTTSVGSCDIYSNENRIINCIARMLALEYGTWNFSSTEFQDSINSLIKQTRTYDGITVDPVSWDGSLFTYLFPAQFFREMETSYGTNSIDKAIECQIRYMENNGRFAFGISDAIPPTGYVNGYRQGCPPRQSDNPDNDPDLGLITPGSLIMSIVSSYNIETAKSLYYILTNNPACFSTDVGFRSTVSVTNNVFSEDYSALDDGHAILALANISRETAWNTFYANQVVADTHNELFGNYPNDIAPPVVWSEPATGEYIDNVTVVLNANDAASGSGLADIWFTTDGSNPLTSSNKQKYTSPLLLTNDTILTISAVDIAGNETFPQKYSYTIIPEPTIIFFVLLLFIKKIL